MLFRSNSVVEKPDPKKAPSNQAVIGRYILPKTIFSELKKKGINRTKCFKKIIDYVECDKKLYSKLLDWIFTPHLYATFSENGFRELIGYEKYNAHLSYFYGVTIERCLISYTEEELFKRQISYGNFVRYTPEDVYSKIYNISYNELIEEFLSKYNLNPNSLTEIEFENFTYWCFKKRVENSEPSKLASDTKKGTMFLYKFFTFKISCSIVTCFFGKIWLISLPAMLVIN